MVTGIIGKKSRHDAAVRRGRHGVSRRRSSRPARAWSCRRRRADERRLRGRAARARRGDARREVNKPPAGHFKKASVPPTRVRREVAAQGGRRAPKAGDQVLRRRSSPTASASTSSATSRGKGFQGVMKRHHFARRRATHGSMFHRAPGSIGASSYPVARRQGHARGRPHGRRPRDDAQPEGAAGRRREQPADRRGRGAGRARAAT